MSSYFMIEGREGDAIVDEAEAVHLYLTREDAQKTVEGELDPETAVVVEIDLVEPEEDDDVEQELLYLVRDKASEDLLTTEEEREGAEPMVYVMAFVDPEDAEAFVDGELKEAGASEGAEIVEAKVVRL